MVDTEDSTVNIPEDCKVTQSKRYEQARLNMWQ